MAKPSGDYIPLGGFVLSERKMSDRPAFQLICIKCGALGIVLDYTEGAPLSTPIECRGCGGLRGTLGDLRTLAGRTSMIPSISALSNLDRLG
jgi:hypothetical protein